MSRRNGRATRGSLLATGLRDLPADDRQCRAGKLLLAVAVVLPGNLKRIDVTRSSSMLDDLESVCAKGPQPVWHLQPVEVLDVILEERSPHSV